MAFEETLQPAEPAVAAPPPSPRHARVPWGLADMAKAVGLIILGVVVISVPAAVIASVVAGSADIDEDAGALVVVLAASLVLELVILLSALLFSLRKYHASWADLGLRWPRRGGWWLSFALVLMGVAIVRVYFALLSLAGAEPESAVPDQAFESLAPLVLLALLSLLFAPIMEELFFRGFIFGGLRARWGTLSAALASGLLFGLAHVGNPGTAYNAVPIAAVGAVFALGYAYSGSLLATIGAHFLFNLVSFVVGLAT